MSAPPPTIGTGRPLPAVARLSAAGGLLLGVDFDGTLSPIVDDPDAAAITPDCRRVLRRFAGDPRAEVGVISGRALADLRGRVGLDGVVYAGNHGLELATKRGVAVHPAVHRSRPALDRLLAMLPGRLVGLPGWAIDDKGASVTVHVRRTPPHVRPAAAERVAAAARAAGGGLRTGRAIKAIEVRPGVDWDKGATLRCLATALPGGWRTVYLGDGFTDQPAFRAVGPDGLAVVVGPRSGPAAALRLPSQAAVAPFLARLARHVLATHPTRS